MAKRLKTVKLGSDLPSILDLRMALDDWEPPSPAAKERLEAALARLEDVPLDLNEMGDEKLMSVDTVAQNRRLYIGSLLRLWHYMARRPETIDEEEAQARIGLGYVKHIEGSKSLKLNLGRTQADDKLAKEVADLRNEMANVVRKKQKMASEHKVIDVESRSQQS